MAKKKTTKKRAKKPRKRKPQAEPKPYFIGISDPAELRKHILEPTREVIQFLQSYEDFQRTKEEKTQTIIQLKEDLKAIKTQINKLRRFLPKSKLKIERPPEKIKEEIKKEKKLLPKKPAPKEEPLPPKPTGPPSELETLEKELGAIEKKLGTLSE